MERTNIEVDGEMKSTTFVKCNKAVAGVIEALLLVALVAIVISTIQLYYIPQVMEQREAEHMDQVSNQFSSLKSMIDLQAMTQSDAPIFSMLTLGSRQLPYFITAGAYGVVSVHDTDEWSISVTYGANIYELTSIKYEAHNFYFPEPDYRQDYILEGGGIILEQYDGNVMRVDPAISVVNGTYDIDIYYDLPIFIGTPGKNETQGEGLCFIRTNYSEGDINIINNAISINISTRYSNAWNESLYNMLGDNVNYNVGETYVEIIEKEPKEINFHVTYYYIYVQIGPGWIK